MDPRCIRLYDAYTHTPLPRREFLARLTSLVGSAAAAAALLPLLEGRARADVVPPDDPRLETSRVGFPGANGELRGYLARPLGEGPWPCVLVIHENRGLNAHIEDVSRRLALAGFVALAPDALSGSGGTPADQDEARALIRALEPDAALADYGAAARFLAEREDGNGKVGCVGFCWGGGMSNRLAATGGVAAAVVYYGRAAPLEEVPAIACPLLLHHAGLDERINGGLPAFEAALKEHSKPYTLHLYEGVNHAFNNDTNEARYDAEAAALAWSRTLDFFKSTLGGAP